MKVRREFKEISIVVTFKDVKELEAMVDHLKIDKNHITNALYWGLKKELDYEKGN